MARTFTKTQVRYLVQRQSGAVWYILKDITGEECEWTNRRDAVEYAAKRTDLGNVRVLQETTLRRVAWQIPSKKAVYSG